MDGWCVAEHVDVPEFADQSPVVERSRGFAEAEQCLAFVERELEPGLVPVEAEAFGQAPEQFKTAGAYGPRTIAERDPKLGFGGPQGCRCSLEADFRKVFRGLLRQDSPGESRPRRAAAFGYPKVQDPGLDGGDLNVSGASSEMECARWRLDRAEFPKGAEARRLGHGGWNHFAVGVKTGPVPSWSEGRVALSDTSRVIQCPLAACEGNPQANA